jgi:hypothetical protein
LPKKNITQWRARKPKSNLEDFAVIPGALRIEKLLEQILLSRETPRLGVLILFSIF